MILTGNDAQKIALLKSLLDHLFKIKDLGQLKFFLGLEVTRLRKGIFLNQRKYTLELLDVVDLLGFKSSNTPMDPQIKLNSKESHLLEDIFIFRRLIGQLIYLTNTRPDIHFVVNHLSQFLSASTMTHYQAVLRVLRYLKGNPGWGFFFPSDSLLQLKDFHDLDWASCLETYRSVNSFCMFLGDSLISWRSKKQHTISRFSSEAEYRALASATCEIQRLSYLLRDLHIVP